MIPLLLDPAIKIQRNIKESILLESMELKLPLNPLSILAIMEIFQLRPSATVLALLIPGPV